MIKFGWSVGLVYKQRNFFFFLRIKDILLGKGKSYSSNKRGYGVVVGVIEQGFLQNLVVDVVWMFLFYCWLQGQVGGWVNIVVVVKILLLLFSFLWICLCYVNDLFCV